MRRLGFINPSGNLMYLEISGNRITKYGTLQQGSVWWTSNITGLKLSVSGIVKEFPDLKDLSSEEIVTEGIKRFYQKLESFSTEQEVEEYLKEDLAKHGYELKMVDRPGFRSRRRK